MTNSADPDQLASSEAEAKCSRSTLFAKTGHVVFSKRRVNSVKSARLALLLNIKTSRLMKLHSHIHHNAPSPLPSTVTDLDLLFMLG